MKETSSLSEGTNRVEEKPQGLGLTERLGLIGLIDEGMRSGSTGSPIVGDLFNDLWDLVNTTVSGSKIDPLKPEESINGFRVFEINAETGENLGRLNMLYLRKPLPCYYLVYVEVAAPYRRNGLGNRILEYFRDFLVQKSAIGILDNIIPKEDPTYRIYHKQAWEPVEAVIGDTIVGGNDNYMVFIPPGLERKDLREPVLKLVYHLRRKRAAIDMRDNELMVQRTITEFKELYSALLAYFHSELRAGEATALMRFMFTRFVTKLIAFRRRIGSLVGYTGGDSLEQIVLAPELACLPAQSYAPKELPNNPHFVTGDTHLWVRLPESLKKNPARVIESLPNYRRPSFSRWLENRSRSFEEPLTIGDLMDLGFDPTRLKELSVDGEAFIFERIQARQLSELAKKTKILSKIASKTSGVRVRSAQLKVNPPLLVIRDRGNAYVLRRKVQGIHWEEATEQLQSSPALKKMNEAMRFDQVVFGTVRKAKEFIEEYMDESEQGLLDQLTCFVAWDLEKNRPKLFIDFAGAYLETVWLT
jgi:hypothetical protein